MSVIHKKLTALALAVILAITPVAQGMVDLGVTAYAAEQSYVSISIDHSAGAYMRPFKLNIYADSKAKLYYTTNGSKPTTASKLYSGAIPINKTTTVWVLAVQAGKEDAYYTLDYTITGTGALYNSKKKYYYNTLTAKQKTAFDRYAYALEHYENWVTMADLQLSQEDWDKVNLAINWEYPQYCDRFGGCTNGVNSDLYVAYRLTPEESERMNAEIEAVAAPVIAQAMTKKTTLAKVRYVINWLVSHTRFTVEDCDTDPQVFTPYGLFVKGKGVCNSYAHCFNYLMQAMEIPVVSLHVNSGTHAANKVCIDGKWYCVDVSWTDIGYTSRVRDICTFEYYLTSDKTFYKTHKPGCWGNTPFVLDLPVATSDDLNKKIAAEEARLWHPSFSCASLTEKDKDGNPIYVTADFEIDTENVCSNAPFSYKMVSMDYNNMGISRTFDVKPNTKYRLSAMTKFSGSGYDPGSIKRELIYGTYLCVDGYTKYDGFNNQNKWKRIEEEFTTNSNQKEISISLRMGGPYYFEDKQQTRAKGTSWFCDIKLEEYSGGKWKTVDASPAIGTGFYNLESVRKDISSLTTAEISDITYSGKKKTPAVTLTDGGYKLKKGIDYAVTYTKNKSVGMASAIVTGKGLYKGTKTINFRIVPKQPKLTITKKNGKLILSVSKVTGAKEYGVFVSKDGQNFEFVKTLTPDNLKVSIPYSSKHTYQFAVSAYRFIGSELFTGGYVYSKTI